ncbi:unnamed protein product [Triticum turgidum subsp. durum]|uniref:Uncharacterized protein n=1 Tax=Triticum turgidum subsp. durum TaxID=4567 RepID=A0A9R1C6C9_TRITD|nr:unnamed protein product [Triticum turgidum subsp. durum]
MDMAGPRWKKGKDGKDFAALAAAHPMSSIVAELQSSLKGSKLVATLSSRGRDATLGVNLQQALLLNRAAFGRALDTAEAEKPWFQLGAEEVFYLYHGLKCISVSESKKLLSEGELWDHLCSASESFPEMYKAYSHLRSKNWVVRSVPEGVEFGGRCGRLKVWSDLLCALRASGSVAKTLLVLTVSSSICELSSPDCLEQLVVHERTITRWIAQQCREQRCEPSREEANKEEQDHTRERVVFNYWGVILGFTVLSSLLVYKLIF